MSLTLSNSHCRENKSHLLSIRFLLLSMITRKKKLSNAFLYKVQNTLPHLEKEIIDNYDVHLSSFVTNNSSKDRGIRFLIRRCHWRWKDTPAVIPASCLFTNTRLSVCLSLPWRFSSYFQSTFSFFQADQNKSFGDKAVFEVFNHTNILALTPLIFLLNLGQFVCLNFFFF